MSFCFAYEEIVMLLNDSGSVFACDPRTSIVANSMSEQKSEELLHSRAGMTSYKFVILINIALK